MDGDIDVTSEEGFGSTFTVSIRVPVNHDTQALIKTPRKQSNLKIFMVEDIELNITVARSLLESLGHEVTVVMTGQEAQIVFHPEDYDLVLLDIQLPDMTGFDIAQYYREKYSKLPPLVALTANVLNNKQEYLQKGMDEAISKPLSVKAIQDVISKFIENKPEVIKKVEVIKPVVSSIDTTLLDIDMLESYVDIVGPKPVLDSIAMFEDMMPEYMEILNSNMVAKDQASIVSEAHKIKGAAGSIGLKRIQQVAQKAQSPDMPAWWDNISDWVDEINNEYQNDIEVLKSWLNQR